jgi:hypothetical protein
VVGAAVHRPVVVAAVVVGRVAAVGVQVVVRAEVVVEVEVRQLRQSYRVFRRASIPALRSHRRGRTHLRIRHVRWQQRVAVVAVAAVALPPLLPTAQR